MPPISIKNFLVKAIALPFLRAALIEDRAELAAAPPAHLPLGRRRKEEAAEQLRLLATHAPRLVRTYARPLLDTTLRLLLGMAYFSFDSRLDVLFSP